ncbi:zinc finger protein [Colletotrichum tofieldiae]|nr:zinc finger protein [Colletotrichum tofieldiae]
MTFTCGTCWREFPAGWQSREQHLDATGHQIPANECDSCDRFFCNRHAVEQHMNALSHWASDVADNDPNTSVTTVRTVSLMRRIFATTRFRTTTTASRAIATSKTTTTFASTLRCPFCNQPRNTATGLIHHLEQGACPNAPLDRDKLYEAVRQRDPNGIISKNLLEWHSSPTYTATERAHNATANAYECYLCHRLFNTLQGLNSHLNSTVHKQVLYHCPNRRCGREFKTLAGVISHLESESCDFMRFDSVQRKVERIVDPNRMIAF